MRAAGMAATEACYPPWAMQDGVLCHSEEISRQAACEVMRELYGLEVQPDEFLPFTVSHAVLNAFEPGSGWQAGVRGAPV